MISPYSRPPAPPQVALLTPDGTMLCEDGSQRPLEAAGANWRLYGSYETVAELLYAERGEALCWNGEPVRYRLQRRADGWQAAKPSDVRVLHVPFPFEPERALRGLVRFRDWLARYGARPGSLGQASWSLLQATLRGPLWTNVGDSPPIRWTMGGRVELAVPRGSYDGDLRHYDLRAAYASTLGRLPYGGRWHCYQGSGPRWLLDLGFPCFVRAQVRVPKGLRFGPLAQRPRSRRTPWQATFDPVRYPVGKRLRGVWTLEEIEEAERCGCIVTRLQTWLHIPAVDRQAGDFRRPFAPWWAAIEEGRRMHGFGGLLAKVCGNALWGQLCMSPGRRAVLSVDRKGNRKLRAAPVQGGRVPAHDLSETISGRVRARLGAFMREAPGLLCVHTDGAWLQHERGYRAPYGWREKERADWLQLVSPQILSYLRRGDDEPTYVFAGVPLSRAERVFRDYWQLSELDEERAQRMAGFWLEGAG